ncbi:alpha/beta fold hydrolase [Actinomadura darangshiensis]|uniref:Alpha/beta fold hydrolase n=1 Tax=Actinomadura darangshiensis TaxID=705336 RepID=A0A4R5AAS1_9ACTN|nr:alpha/beta fold hydrolase [Actinomadura darangshiensis]TDD68805.1 alpha/beta fold hydrolase [Actinomadura darangshiensis]
MADAALHVHRYGDPAGAPVVLLHGVTGHGARWRRTAEGYLADRSVLAPDLRGHGRSTHEPPWTVERHVADVLAMMDAEGVDQADFAGHSYGGMIALHLARTAPRRVHRLILLDPAIGLDPAKAAEEARGYLAAPSFADAAEARAHRAEGWSRSPAEAVDDEVAEHLEHGPDGRLRWRFEPAAVVTAYSEMARPHIAPPAGMPTHLVIAAEADLVRPEFVVHLREALGPGLVISEIEAGHMLYLDRPEETGTLLGAWLSGADAGR